MVTEKGNISVQTENIFPIIKKWLYSEKDIFLRELVSNSCDAVTKYKKLSQIGEAPSADGYKIIVSVDSDAGTISFSDNGIGMTAEEVNKYINQIALSGARDFIEKYEDKLDENNQIIGHFGLGFYSAFMVSSNVEIDTLSWQEGAEPVRWKCEGGAEYEMEDGTRSERGTTVTLHLLDDCKEYLDKYEVEKILSKYCAFLPVELYIKDASKTEDSEETEKPINDTNPLWQKAPRDCTDEEYIDFYHKVFKGADDPLFWIHLNADHPFNLKGILYFPRLKNDAETLEGEVKLYYNQVFVADNIKEIIPEFLLLLKGVVDCPDLPLNVSRSFLQNDGYVKKVSAHIVKKVADKLTGMFENDRENYNKFWDDVKPFIKYGCIKDSKFNERMQDCIILKTTKDEYITLKQYAERNGEKTADTIYYANDIGQQSRYIRLFDEKEIDVVLFDTVMDTQHAQFIEMNGGTRFTRVDSGLPDALTEKDDNAPEEALIELFKQAVNKEDLTIKVQGLHDEKIPAIILMEEYARRFGEMSRMFGRSSMNLPMGVTLVINKKSPLIQKLMELESERAKEISRQIYDLAVMGQRPLEPEEMSEYLNRSYNLLSELVG